MQLLYDILIFGIPALFFLAFAATLLEKLKYELRRTPMLIWGLLHALYGHAVEERMALFVGGFLFSFATPFLLVLQCGAVLLLDGYREAAVVFVFGKFFESWKIKCMYKITMRECSFLYASMNSRNNCCLVWIGWLQIVAQSQLEDEPGLTASTPDCRIVVLCRLSNNILAD